MRKCDNCYNGHYNLSDCGEELICDINEVQEECVVSDNSCEYHRYIDGMEEEKNYVFYDESYLGPGFLIVNKQGDKIVKFFKIYTLFKEFPNYCIRAFSVNGRDNPNEIFNNIEFSFRDREDNENGLFNIFTRFANNVSGQIDTIDKFEQGRNYVSVSTNGVVTKFVVSKDVYGVRYPTEFVDINMGDYYSCKYYHALVNLFNDLYKLNPSKMDDEEITKLIRVKLK